MIRRQLIRKPIAETDYLRKTPRRSDYKELIHQDTVFLEDGRPIIVYKNIPQTHLSEFRRLVHESHFIKSQRVNGTPTQSAIFGALPRIRHRHNYCRYTANTMNQKELNESIFAFARLVNDLYKRLLPEEFAHNLQVIEKSVQSEYVIAGTPFTTVNLNVNHAIKYHKDTGNFKNVYSNVLILKQQVQGGFLVCPEFDLAFAQQDGALILFDGQHIVHGVTPIKATGPDAYRCSCVFYALANMKNCYPYEEELSWAKKQRDEIESRFRPDPKTFKL